MTSTHDTTNPNKRPVSDRHASLEFTNGELIIYDGENFSGWIQSDEYVSLAERR